MTQASADYVQQTCAYCEGSGKVSDDQCRACGGHGNVLVAPPPTGCSGCRGTGRTGTARCWKCYGTGWVHVRKRSA